MSEQIGKIVIDDTYYPGQDFYCDGAIEDELLEIVRNYAEIEYPRIIEEKAEWPILYHLSAQRQNVVEWIPVEPGAKVLEVGSGCGAITGALSRKAGTLDCVDLSMKRSKINAYRNQDCDNVTIHVGNFKDIEPHLDTDYDYIFLIGVFEYGQSYMGTKTPYEDFLDMLKRHVKQDGRIIIAIENKYGLKYWAGCQEDHLGSYFDGIENYANGGGVRTFTRNGLEKIFKKTGVKDYHFYYPYPDYKFMTTVYSDEYLPKKGELLNNMRNFDRDRMVLFDEKNAFDGIIEEGEFPLFSNSYLVVLGKDFPVKYTRYSNDRAKEFRIKTEISKNVNGRFEVKKIPLCEEAKQHIVNLGTTYEKLSAKYDGGNLAINRCEIVENNQQIQANLEFLPGKTLAEYMDTCLDEGDIEGFYALFRKYYQIVEYNQTIPATNYDFIFSNIIINENQWNLIDYEWTFEKVIDSKMLAFRAIYCYILENERRNKLNLDYIFELLNISEKEAEEYREKEAEFQAYVTGKKKSMAQIRDMIGMKVFEPKEWVKHYENKGNALQVQVYEDYGNGFSETNSYFVKNAYQGKNHIRFTITVGNNVKNLRVDPAMCACITKINGICFNGVKIELNRKVMSVNGRKAKGDEGVIVFGNEDPNITLDLTKLRSQFENNLTIDMDITEIPVEMAGAIEASMSKTLF